MSMAIVARGLTKTYGKYTAVNNLNLDIPEGMIFGFLGPNGAGKTTTIRMLLGLIQPTAGTAQVLGHDIQKERSDIASKVGAIVESPAFYTYLSGFDNLRVFARTSNLDLDDRKIYALLDRVGLNGRERDKVKTYSLGMKQRLGIAATLLSDPKIIFLDEPTNGLDPAGTVDMRRLIGQLGQEGFTVFLSSHLLYEVEQICTYVAIIQQGNTIAQGRVHDLLADGAGFAIETNDAEQALGVLSQHPELKPTHQNERWISLAATHADVPALVRALVHADIDVYQVQSRQRSLESLFLELTGAPADYQPQAATPQNGRNAAVSQALEGINK